MDVVGACLAAHQNHPFASRFHFDRAIRSQGNLASCGAGTCGQPFADRLIPRFLLRIEDGIEVLSELLRGDAHHGFTFVDHTFFHHVDRNPDCRDAGPLPHSRLQHIELAFLDRKFQVQHVAVMTLQFFIGGHQHLIGLRQRLRQRLDRKRRPDAGHHVFSLRVEQAFSKECRRPCGRVARERHPGATRIAHIPEDHRHDVDRRSPVIGYAVQPAIRDGACAIP